MRVSIVVPTIREENITKFLDVWRAEFENHTVIVVEDSPERTLNVAGPNIRHYCWADIDEELGKDAWIIPRRTDCVRSFGYLKAYEQNSDLIVTLDDDCYPSSPGFIEQHARNISTETMADAWVSTGEGVLPRGMPYQSQQRRMRCVLNHGLWSRVPDYDAVTQLANVRFNQSFVQVDKVIPRGAYFPMCGMNLAFDAELAPAMYFLLMGRDWPFDRFGDIWCGILVKKICDHLGYGVRSGSPVVEHQRASNVWANLRKEAPGYEINETLWQAVDSILLTRETVRGCYKELAEKLPLTGDYWDRLRSAMKVWAGLFSERRAEPLGTFQLSEGVR